MKRILSLALCAGLMLTGAAFAGDLTSGMDIKGGENGFASLMLKRAPNAVQEDGLLKLRVALTKGQKLKGYGFSLQYDQTRYEFVEAKEVTGNLLDTGSGQPTLFLSSNKTSGQIAVGAMKIDGQAAEGNGELVEFTFRTGETPLPTDFQILEGVLVDLTGGVDLVHNIEIGNLKPMPDDYGMDQNLPNPFNPSTTINYQLPEAGRIKMMVYNLLGQEVRALVNEELDAGFHSVIWDGKNELGRQVASGVYMYRIQAGDYTKTLRMMMLK